MHVVRLLQPPKIVFGAGCAAQCAEDILRLGLRRVLVVTSPPIQQHAERIAAPLQASGVEAGLYAGIEREPAIRDFEAALAAAQALRPQAVVGVGGGSALDVAKLVAALYGAQQRVGEVFGIDRLAGRALYLACLPTTAGTGSEVSPNAILLDEAERLKKGVVSPHLVPDAAYVDPLLTLTAPPGVTAATGVDALTHCIEAYANRFAHPIVDGYALAGVRCIAGSLERAVTHGDDVRARVQVALGSLYGGLCLGPVNTAAVHALAYPLGGEHHVAHGVANSVLLPHVLRFNLPACVERYADVARAMGVPDGAALDETAERGVEHLAGLSRACGIPPGLKALGIPRTALPGLAAAAMTVTRLLKNNPRDLTAADAEAIYAAAYE
jgi:alcohol dehydrogenase class IV